MVDAFRDRGGATSKHQSMLGHLSLSPSSQRRYKSSEIGDFRTGEPLSGCIGDGAGDDVEGSPEISSSSVTMRPFAVISLLRMMRLCGNSERCVWMWLRTAGLLGEVVRVSSISAYEP